MNSFVNQSHLIWNQLDHVISVILRIPSLFLIDNYCKHFTSHTGNVSVILSHAALFIGFLLLLLPLYHLKLLYFHLIFWTIFCVSLNLWYNLFYFDTKHFIDYLFVLYSSKHLNHFIFRITNQDLSSVFLLHIFFDSITLILLQSPLKIWKFGIVGYTLFTFIYVLQLYSELHMILNYVSYSILCASISDYLCKYLPILFYEVKLLGKNVILIIKNEGFVVLCLKTFKQIFVPVHFLLFWNINFISQLYRQERSIADARVEFDWPQALMEAACTIYSSPISLLSASITVTYLSCLVLSAIKLFLWGDLSTLRNNMVNVNTNREHNGWEEGLTTLLLTSITALTDMNSNARMAVLIIIFLVVLSSLLQSILEISEPAILSLNMNHNTNRVHHLKVFLLCAILFIFPLYVTSVYAQLFPVNFWILVVFSTSLLISARVLDLVIIHCLFWWDSYQKEPWEYLDEVVYYVRSFTKILEFMISISVVMVGLWEVVNYRSNVINSSILFLHCYFNVWQRINEGFHSFWRRREANRIVDSMQYAAEEQISKFSDLCCICYMEMIPFESKGSQLVVSTKCDHLFHRQCIKKWFFIQNRCPLCATEISPYVSKQFDQCNG